jgi:hypothetical protein
VQRIIAGTLEPTAAPTATTTPPPNCAGAIWSHEARLHLGESRTVEGRVVAARAAPNGSMILEVGQQLPDPLSLAAVVTDAAGNPTNLTGRTVCLSGRLSSSEGVVMIEVRSASSIVVLN